MVTTSGSDMSADLGFVPEAFNACGDDAHAAEGQPHPPVSCAGLTRAAMMPFNSDALSRVPLPRFIMDGRVEPGHDRK